MPSRSRYVGRAHAWSNWLILLLGSSLFLVSEKEPGRVQGYISRGQLGRGRNTSLQASKQQNKQKKREKKKEWTKRPTVERTDRAFYRVACIRLDICGSRGKTRKQSEETEQNKIHELKDIASLRHDLKEISMI